MWVIHGVGGMGSERAGSVVVHGVGGMGSERAGSVVVHGVGGIVCASTVWCGCCVRVCDCIKHQCCNAILTITMHEFCIL